jgi:hypothetical protein
MYFSENLVRLEGLIETIGFYARLLYGGTGHSQEWKDQ